MFSPGTLGLLACTCLKQLATRVRLSALLRRGGGVVFCFEAESVSGGSAAVCEGVCCAGATVTTDSAAKANAARFTEHLLCCALSLVSPLLPKLSDAADIYT